MPLAEQLEQLHVIAGTIRGVIVNSRRSSTQRMKDEVENYVREHYNDPGLCAELIAQELLISEKYVFAIIKEQTGESNGRISLLCGFGSENTFYRAFSRRHGVPPAYGERIKGDARGGDHPLGKREANLRIRFSFFVLITGKPSVSSILEDLTEVESYSLGQLENTDSCVPEPEPLY